MTRSATLNIECAVQTAPRAKPRLLETLAALARAGFPSPLVVADYAGRGCYQTYLRTMLLLARTASDADYWLICEDDIEPAAGLDVWLSSDHSHLPVEPGEMGLISLYTCASNHRTGRTGWNVIERLPHHTHIAIPWGALAYLWPVSLAMEYLASPRKPTDREGTDHHVGVWLRERGIPAYCHSPSLVRHTGIVPWSDTSLACKLASDADRQCAEWVPDLSQAIEGERINAWKTERYAASASVLD